MYLNWPLRVALLALLSFIERSETFFRSTHLSFKPRRQSRSAITVPNDLSESSSQEDWDVRNSMNTHDDNQFSGRSKRMNLTWCNKVSCRPSSMIREQIVGQQNQIAFRGSATGQVMFNWECDQANNTTYIPRVLLLVKKNDDALLKVAEKVRGFKVDISYFYIVFLYLCPNHHLV